jgi:hypothetical protein
MVHRLSCVLVLLFLAAALAAPPPVDQSSVLHYLNQTIHWYRDVDSVERSAGSADTLIAQDSVAQTSKKAGQLAFDFARAARQNFSTITIRRTKIPAAKAAA